MNDERGILYLSFVLASIISTQIFILTRAPILRVGKHITRNTT